jgi:hypothetical protein
MNNKLILNLMKENNSYIVEIPLSSNCYLYVEGLNEGQAIEGDFDETKVESLLGELHNSEDDLCNVYLNKYCTVDEAKLQSLASYLSSFDVPGIRANETVLKINGHLYINGYGADFSEFERRILFSAISVRGYDKGDWLHNPEIDKQQILEGEVEVNEKLIRFEALARACVLQNGFVAYNYETESIDLLEGDIDKFVEERLTL